MRRLLDEHAVRNAHGTQDMRISRNRSGQGAPGAGGDGIVPYVEGFESPDNEVYGNLYNQHCVYDVDAI